MSLKTLILEKTKEAMREKAEGKNKLTFLRSISSEVKNMEIAMKKEATDEDYINATVKLKVQAEDSLDMYAKALSEVPTTDTTRQEELQLQVDKHKEWIAVAESILPEPLSEEEVIQKIKEIVVINSCTGMKDMKIVMPLIMTETKGRFDGKKVNQLVATVLKSL